MLPWALCIAYTVCTVTFQPKDMPLEHVSIDPDTIMIALGVNTLRESQDIFITGEELKGTSGAMYPVDLRVYLQPVSTVYVFLDELGPFTPFNVLRIEDFLCGSTTLNNPCVNSKSLCCVDLQSGTTYYKCSVPMNTSYKAYKISRISTSVGLNVRVKSESEEYMLALNSSNSASSVSIGSLRLQFTVDGMDFTEERLASLIDEVIIQTERELSLSDLNMLLDRFWLSLDADKWINTASCTISRDLEFDFVRETMPLINFLDGTYTGVLVDGAIQLTRNIDIVTELTITAG